MQGLVAEPFHAGERAAQLMAGIVRRDAPIRDHMPDQHRRFFEGLRYLPVALLDQAAGPVASLLSGPAGFVQSPDANTLVIAARPAPGEPATAALLPGVAMGVLGIELATRRRNRANGRVARVEPGGFVLEVAESFGNCPQYIQLRDVAGPVASGAPVERMSGLDDAARRQIGEADTFFVASVGPRGMDMSHRGGMPGFVRVTGSRLSIPDFSGNGYFNTLGNLMLDPRAALLFVDFASGDELHIGGHVTIDWQPPTDFPGAERLWHLEVGTAWRRPGGAGLRWAAAQPAPTTLRAGSWVGRK